MALTLFPPRPALPPTDAPPGPSPDVVSTPPAFPPAIEESLVELRRRGLAAHQAGRLEEAETLYRQLLAQDPDYGDARHLLALVLDRQGHRAEAESLLRQALARRPEAYLYSSLACLLQADGRIEQAKGAYCLAIQQKPDYFEAYNNLGVLLKDSGYLEEAEAAYRRALSLNPDYTLALNNLGVVCRESNRLAEAETCYRQALAQQPDYADALSNLGVVLREMGHLAEAERCYRRTLALDPEYANARWNLGLLLLSQGRHREGWACYEARYHPRRTEGVSKRPDVAFPQWQGESLAGKSLLLWPEQGAGDYIQFARYFSALRQQGLRRLTVACRPALAPLFESLASVDQVIGLAPGARLADHDYWSFPLSLPAFLPANADAIPTDLPYLQASPERLAQWRERLAGDGLKVGLVWKGNPDHKSDARRSLPGLATLAPLWSVPGVRFFSLQKGAGEAEASAPPAHQPLVDLGSAIDDFADSAAIIAQLDLMICVDTAAAHLAGALNKPCWVLVQAVDTDWRWQLEGEDAPWYPGALRIFRQTTDDDWAPVVAQVAAALARLAAPQADA